MISNRVYERIQGISPELLIATANSLKKKHGTSLWTNGFGAIWDALVMRGWELGISLPSRIEEYTP